MKSDKPLKKGYVHIYTGDGKGKTTAALGLALRAVGNGLKVLIIQFLKSEDADSGELKAAERFAPDLDIRPRGEEGFIDPGNIPAGAFTLAAEALAESEKEIQSGNWDIVVLDEINVAVAFSLVNVREVLDIVNARPEGVELVLTGRFAPAEFIDVADLVTEMKAIKHYFEEGVSARDGIEK
jgi:cob(I)alamin adenosyltransferase